MLIESKHFLSSTVPISLFFYLLYIEDKLGNSLLNIEIVYLCLSFANESFKPEAKVKTFGKTIDKPLARFINKKTGPK